MKIKQILVTIACLAFIPFSIQGSDLETRMDTEEPLAMNADTSSWKKFESTKKIWKRKGFLYFSYGKQTLENDFSKSKSQFDAAFLSGKSIYLHRKPIIGMMKLGLDFLADLNVAKYENMKDETSVTSLYSDIFDDEEDVNAEGESGFDTWHLDIGAGIGPSLTINPIDHLKACVYFHVTPTYSMILQDSELYSHYTTFFNVGLTLSYKVISIGVEQRWCGKTDYGTLSDQHMNDFYDQNGQFVDPFQFVDQKFKTHTTRVFVGFRF